MEKDSLIEEFFGCFKSWDYNKIKEFCNPEVEWTIYADKPIGGIYKGLPEILNLIKKLQEEFPEGLKFEFISVIKDKKGMAVEWQDFGMRKNNETYKNRGMNFILLDEKGRIYRISEIIAYSPIKNNGQK